MDRAFHGRHPVRGGIGRGVHALIKMNLSINRIALLSWCTTRKEGCGRNYIYIAMIAKPGNPSVFSVVHIGLQLVGVPRASR